jgi:hypothetical protein
MTKIGQTLNHQVEILDFINGAKIPHSLKISYLIK